MRGHHRFQLRLIEHAHLTRAGGEAVPALRIAQIPLRDGQYVGDRLVDGPVGARHPRVRIGGSGNLVEACQCVRNAFPQLVSGRVDQGGDACVVHSSPYTPR